MCVCVCVCETLLIIYIILCQGESKENLILDIDVWNTMYVLHPKGTHGAYLNLNLQQHQRVKLIWLMHLNNKLILDRATFDMIRWKWINLAQIYFFFFFACRV